MADLPDGMHVFTVCPKNYDEILEWSQKTEKPYVLADLKAMEAQASEKNSVAMVCFKDVNFWRNL